MSAFVRAVERQSQIFVCLYRDANTKSLSRVHRSNITLTSIQSVATRPTHAASINQTFLDTVFLALSTSASWRTPRTPNTSKRSHNPRNAPSSAPESTRRAFPFVSGTFHTKTHREAWHRDVAARGPTTPCHSFPLPTTTTPRTSEHLARDAPRARHPPRARVDSRNSASWRVNSSSASTSVARCLFLFFKTDIFHSFVERSRGASFAVSRA